MGFSPSEKHNTTASIYSSIVDAASGSFTESLTVSGTPVAKALQYIYLRDEKAQATQGGSFDQGAMRTRVLNTIVTDETGEVTLVTNQFTLPAGSYSIHAICPAVKVNGHYAQLYNISDSAIVVRGNNALMSSVSGGVTSHATVIGKFTIGAPKTFEIQHQCQSTLATYGFGWEHNLAVEVFTIVELWKVS